MALDIRVNTDALDDYVRLGLSTDAFTALIMLQLKAIKNNTDGFLTTQDLEPKGAYHGIPHVNDRVISELIEAGLANWVDGGLQVTWQWQTTAESREKQRRENKVRQQRWRDSQKEQERATDVDHDKATHVTHDEHVSNTHVTRYGNVSNAGVGKDRTGIGSKDRTSQKAQPQTVPYSEDYRQLKPPPKDPPRSTPLHTAPNIPTCPMHGTELDTAGRCTECLQVQ